MKTMKTLKKSQNFSKIKKNSENPEFPANLQSMRTFNGVQEAQTDPTATASLLALLGDSLLGLAAHT